MRLRRLGPVSVALSSVLLVAFLAGCGSKSPDLLTEKTLFPRVAAAQAKAGSSHVSMRLTSPSGVNVQSYGQMRTGKSAKDTAMAMTVTGGTGELGNVELRLVDRSFYITLGALTDNKFVKVDLTDKSNPIAQQYGNMIENIDPARQVRQFADAVTKFDSSGKTAKLDGVQTQPYRITIDPSKSEQLKDVKSLPRSVTFTIYVGADDLPRRMVSQIPGADGVAPTKMQMDYTKWGEDVSIKAPGPANLTDDSLLSRLTGG